MSDHDSDPEIDSADENDEKKADREDPRNPDVVTKYRLASDIANDAVKSVMAAAVPGAKIYDLCVMSDEYIEKTTAPLYKKGKAAKGIGFPTCISVNHIVGSFSPLKDNETALANGDVVKVDLGVHLDGYLALVAHTFVVRGPDEKITGDKARLLHALATAVDCAKRLVKPGVNNTDVTKCVDAVVKDYELSTIEGVYSHEMQRNQIDCEKVVANNIPDVPLTGDNKTKEEEFEPNEVWGLDVVISTGSGKPHRETDKETTVYKRLGDNAYRLKLQAARGVYHEVAKKFPHFPFSLRQLDFDKTKARVGLSNCAQHDLVEDYPVLYEKQGELVAHYKFTAILLANGVMHITGLPIDLTNVECDMKPKSELVLNTLKLPLPTKKKKSKGKKKKKKPEAAAAAAAP